METIDEKYPNYRNDCEKFVLKLRHHPRILIQAVAKAAFKNQNAKLKFYLQFIQKYKVPMDWKQPVQLKPACHFKNILVKDILTQVTGGWCIRRESEHPNAVLVLKQLLDVKCDP